MSWIVYLIAVSIALVALWGFVWNLVRCLVQLNYPLMPRRWQKLPDGQVQRGDRT